MNKRIGVSLGLFFYALNTILACSCIGETSATKAVKNAATVFVGKVISKEKIAVAYPNQGPQFIFNIYHNKFTFKVLRKIKGEIVADNIEVITGMGSGDCGFQFMIGKEYVVYANWKDQYVNEGERIPKFLFTNICTRTTNKVAEEEDAIAKGGRRIRK